MVVLPDMSVVFSEIAGPPCVRIRTRASPLNCVPSAKRRRTSIMPRGLLSCGDGCAEITRPLKRYRNEKTQNSLRITWRVLWTSRAKGGLRLVGFAQKLRQLYSEKYSAGRILFP